MKLNTIRLSKDRLLIDCTGNPRLSKSFEIGAYKFMNWNYPDIIGTGTQYLNGSEANSSIIKNWFNKPKHIKTLKNLLRGYNPPESLIIDQKSPNKTKITK